jgi:hypothetical protein
MVFTNVTIFFLIMFFYFDCQLFYQKCNFEGRRTDKTEVRFWRNFKIQGVVQAPRWTVLS